jgi:predicted PurR-regulated permease PerM
MNYQKLQAYFFVAVLILVICLNAFVFLPYLSAIALASVFAIVFKPVYEKLKKFLGDKGAFSAFITTLVVMIAIVAPLIFIGSMVFEEAGNLYVRLLSNGGTSVFARSIQNFLRDNFPSLNINIWQYAQEGLRWFLTSAGTIFTSITSGIITLLISFLAMYYFLKDGDQIKQYLISISPLSDKDDKLVWDKLHIAVNSVIRGSLIIAIIQGILAGIGFSLFDVPSPAFWGAVAAFTALIPSVGTSLVLGPAIIYLFLSGDVTSGIGLLIWGVTIVGLIDNLLAPKIMERKMEIHPLLILFSVLGGLSLFGVMGFVIGPLLVSLLAALLNIYQNEFKDYFDKGGVS